MAVLPQSLGYGIVVGVGMAFAIVMIGITAALRRYQKEHIDAEEFATAGRSVNSGLIASAVVSSWTWAATLMQSTTEGFEYGVSGPFWYASGGTVQIITFVALAIELKRKAPGAHTFLEVIRARFGTVAHIVFIFYAFAANILVTAMLLTGSSANIEYLTGMHPVASIVLIPLGVTIYTLCGGLKATFLTDYIHTWIIYIVILCFAFNTFATNDLLGSPGKVWDLLMERAQRLPVDGNEHGSYLTMKSHFGGLSFLITIAGGFGTVWLDQGYWSKAIAARPSAAYPGYIVGGLAWFAIPFLTASTFGLAGLCLEYTQKWPTYPAVMSSADVLDGLTLPNAAVALLGKNGGAAALLLVFMAVTSACSAELVAASSILTYDVYKCYINPRATSKQLIFVTHIGVIGFISTMIGFAIGLYYGGVGMGYLYDCLATIIGSGTIPAGLTMYWSGFNTLSACITPPLGMALGIAVWIGTTAGLYNNTFTVATTGEMYPMLAGNLVSLLSPLIIIPICQLIGGHAHYDFADLKELQSLRAVLPEALVGVSGKAENLVEELEASHTATDNKDNSVALVKRQEAMESSDHRKSLNISSDEEGIDTEAEIVKEALDAENAEYEKDQAILNKYAKISTYTVIFLVLALVIVWPMPMYGSGYIFSKKFFTGWIVVAFIWFFLSMFSVTLWPLWQGRESIWHTLRGLYWDATGKSYKVREWQQEHPEELHHVFSPVSAV